MIDTLKFVQGAVARKDYVPSLVHFRIHNGFVLGYNGSLALCSPINVNLSCSPKATSFVKAVQMCDETVQLHMTPNGRLAVKSGSFSAFVDCLPNDKDFPNVAPEGQEIPLQGNLLETLEVLAPFIAEDASRPWARGVLFRGQSAYATNNVVVVERWLGTTLPVEINVPEEAVKELLRIGDPPTRLQVSENSATFHFEGDRWLRCQLYSTQWPDVTPVLDRPAQPTPVPPGFFEALEKLGPFVDEMGRCFFRDGKVATGQADDTGAFVQVDGLSVPGCYNLKQLQLLKGVTEQIDFGMYPAPCLFYGDALRGAIVGMRI